MARNHTVLVLAVRPDPDALRRTVARLRDAGVRVLLASSHAVPEDVTEAVDGGVRELFGAAQAHGPAFRRALRRAGPAERFSLHVERDPWVAERLAGVSVVVALGTRPRLAATRLATGHPRLRTADSAKGALELLRGGEVPPPRRFSRRLRVGVPPPAAVVRLLLARAPGLAPTRRADLAARTARRLLEGGDESRAEGVVRAVLPHLPDARARADLLGDVVSGALADGLQPDLAREAYATELEVADRHLREGRTRAAAESFDEAMRTAFHRVLHFDGTRSPLAEDPPGFVAPLAASEVGAALRAPARTERDTSGATGADAPDRPVRLLVTTRRNADFLGEIRSHFDAHAGYETRFVDAADLPPLQQLAKRPPVIVESVLADGGALVRETVERAYRDHLDWADVVLVEWCTALAALLSRVHTGRTRVVVRMHSYEAFTQWPHLTDFSRVDDVVFVSDHLRDLAVAAIPGLRGPHAPRLHVIANAMELSRFVGPKDPEARFTLGVVGASKVVKDPLWAIQVLRELRRHDERYRLLLVRGKLQDDTAATREYARALRAALDELEPLGAVEVLGHTDDVPEVLRRIGVAVSSSVRESFHMGLVEGVASGALPVVRDWPFFPGAARALFPDDWVVDGPAQAAARILASTATEETWREAAGEAAAHVLARWDWPVVRGDFETLLRPCPTG